MRRVWGIRLAIYQFWVRNFKSYSILLCVPFSSLYPHEKISGFDRDFLCSLEMTGKLSFSPSKSKIMLATILTPRARKSFRTPTWNHMQVGLPIRSAPYRSKMTVRLQYRIYSISVVQSFCEYVVTSHLLFSSIMTRVVNCSSFHHFTEKYFSFKWNWKFCPWYLLHKYDRIVTWSMNFLSHTNYADVTVADSWIFQNLS